MFYVLFLSVLCTSFNPKISSNARDRTRVTPMKVAFEAAYLLRDLQILLFGLIPISLTLLDHLISRIFVPNSRFIVSNRFFSARIES